MKNNRLLLLIPLLLSLFSCGHKGGNSINDSEIVYPSIDDSVDSGSDDSVDNNVTLTFFLKNVLDGYLQEASFILDGEEVNYSFSNNKFSINTTRDKLGSTLLISAPNYENKEIIITSFSLNTISIEKPYTKVGKVQYNSNALYDGWELYTTRGLDNLQIKLVSSYDHFINSNNVTSVYLNTGDTSSSLGRGDYQFKLKSDSIVVYDYGFIHDEIDTSIFNYSIKNEIGTELYLSIPYSFTLIDSGDVVGITISDYLKDADIITNLQFDERTIDVNDTTSYPRVNVKNRAFMNVINADNPKWISQAEYRELTQDKEFSFANPKYNRHKEDADDVYFNIDYTETMLAFDFIWFGDLTDSEYFQIVIHNNIIDKNSWQLCHDDVILNIFKTNTKIYTNVNEFWDVQNNKATLLSTIPNNTFVDYDVYSSLSISIPLENIPNIHSLYDDIYIMAGEFDGTIFYDGINYNEELFRNSLAVGDPADMISYQLIDAPKVRISNLTSEEKSELIGSRNISFANPIDVNIKKADDIYMDMKKTDTGISIDIIGFGDFCPTEIVTFVFHESSVDGEEWNIQKEDVTLMVSQNQAKFVKNTTDFWVGTRITRGTSSTISPVKYERFDGYFTLKIDVEYLEIGSGLSKTSQIRMYAFEFGFGGVLYNCEPWTKSMRLNGVSCGDPAFQKNYILIP